MLREEVIERLRAVGIHPDKKLGQYFLVDDTALATIIREADLGADDTVLEIGAGLGTLTEALCRRAGRVIAYEPDERLYNFLRERFEGEFDNLELREKYINRYELDEIFAEFPEGLKIVSNLPYGITSEVVVSTIGVIRQLADVVLMLQHEVVKRLTAHPDNKCYGSLTVYAQTFAYAEELMFVPRDAFIPVPNVDSQIARLRALSRQPTVTDTHRYFRLVQGAFHHRRKTISNALTRTFPELGRTEILRRLARANIYPDRRGDTLSRDEFITLAAILG